MYKNKHKFELDLTARKLYFIKYKLSKQNKRKEFLENGACCSLKVHTPAWVLPVSLAGHESQCSSSVFHQGRNGSLGDYVISSSPPHVGRAVK